MVVFSQDGRRLTVFVHRIVCEAFHGQPPTQEHESAHWDGDAQNNTPSNLRWATHLENEHDKQRHGTVPKGPAHWTAARTTEERHRRSKLTAEALAEIRNATIVRGSITMLARRFNVSHQMIGHILRGRAWKPSVERAPDVRPH